MLQVFDLVKENRRYDKKQTEYDVVDGHGKKSENQPAYAANSLNKVDDDCLYAGKAAGSSPKQKSKFPKFWSSGNMGSGSKNCNNDSPIDMSPLVTDHQNYTNANANTTINGMDVDEKQRRRAFAHYDCQSVITKLGYDGRLRKLLSKRRNTTTGASAASMLGVRSTTPDGDSGEEDAGDGRSNELIDR